MMRIALFVALAFAVFATCQADALKDRQKFFKQDFKFNIADAPLSKAPEGVEIQSILGKQFPPLQGNGIGMALFRFPPCALNPLHVHPRSTELIYVSSGRNLKVGFAEENGGRVIINRLNQGDFTTFPQGLVHFQFNDSCKEVTFVSAQSNDDPGVQSYPARLLDFPVGVISAAFGLKEKEVAELKDTFGTRGRLKKCLQRCGISR